MALSTFNKEWATIFNNASIVFARDINGLMKTDRNMGGGFKSVMSEAQTPTKFSLALAGVDNIDLAAGNPKQIAALPENLKSYRIAQAKLTTEKNSYAATLNESINARVTLVDRTNDNKVPTPMKTAFPDTYRHLKILRAEVDALHARSASALANAENTAKINKISAKTDKALSKVVGFDQTANDKIAAIREKAAMKKFILAFSSSFKSGMAKGAAVIQRIKASPTLAVYNKEMNDGGRDISQNLVNIGKLQANPKFAESELAKKLPPPGALAAAIVPFANGNRRTLPANATPADVQQALADFTAVYKRIAATYADVLAGRI